MFRFFQPQAVWQLVVLALMAVVAPMAWLLYSTVISLQTLTDDSLQLTQESVVLAESRRSARAALIDLERIARQYVVLQDKALLDLYSTSMTALLIPLSNIVQILNSKEAEQLLRNIKDSQKVLAESLQHDEPKSRALERNLRKLADIQNELDKLVGLTRIYAESMHNELGYKATEVRRSVFQSALFLVPITLLLITLFTVLIVHPIERLRLAIRHLGTGKGRPVRLYGPNELVQLARELNSLQVRLTQVDRQKQQFLRHVSHELKTPLASIREGASLLQDELVGKLSAQQKEVVKLVVDNGIHLQKLIENLLQFNRLDYESSRKRNAPGDSASDGFAIFDLNELAAEALRQHWLELSQSGQIVCIGGFVARLKMDRTKLLAALDNLISNAIAYGSRCGKIWILWQARNAGIEIHVRNTGTPIPPTETPYIFDPFYQASIKRSGAVKGSGIGLSVARESIQTQGGELMLTSNLPHNICFCIRLPAAAIQQIQDIVL